MDNEKIENDLDIDSEPDSFEEQDSEDDIYGKKRRLIFILTSASVFGFRVKADSGPPAFRSNL